MYLYQINIFVFKLYFNCSYNACITCLSLVIRYNLMYCKIAINLTLLMRCLGNRVGKKRSGCLYNRPFSSHLVDMATVAKPSKLWLCVVYFNSQVLKRIACFGDLNLRWEYKINFLHLLCQTLLVVRTVAISFNLINFFYTSSR